MQTERPPRERPTRPASPLDIPADRVDAAAALLPPGEATTRLAMRRVRCRFFAGISLQVVALDGEIVRHDPALPLVIENLHSYTIAVHQGDLELDGDSLAMLLNRYTFAFPGSPIWGMRVRFADGVVRLSGTIRKVVNLPFTVIGRPEASPEGGLVLRAQRVLAGKLGIGGLLDLVGLRLDALIPDRSDYGLRVEGDAIHIDIQRLLPPPRFRARVTGAAIGDGMLRLRLDDGVQREPLPLPWPGPASYAHLAGGDLVAGNVHIKHLDAQLVGQDGQPGLDLSLQEYQRQIDAGVIAARDRRLLLVIPPWREAGEAGPGGTPPALPGWAAVSQQAQ